ncbi:MAG: hypothetical protein QG585_597 [Patescibacteria group bacterium]|jgi:hypothetical protein|nr:hypothetical protein [Patescibacteria group bacterium]
MSIYGILSNLSLFTFLLLPIAGLVLNSFFFKKLSNTELFLSLLLFCYLTYVGSAFFLGLQYEADLNKVFDINKNGIFEIEEYSLPGFDEMEKPIVNDAWRSVIPIVGLLVSLIYVPLNYLLFFFGKFLYKKSRHSRAV